MAFKEIVNGVIADKNVATEELVDQSVGQLQTSVNQSISQINSSVQSINTINTSQSTSISNLNTRLSGLYFPGGVANFSNGVIVNTTDGVSWTQDNTSLGAFGEWTPITYGNGLFVTTSSSTAGLGFRNIRLAVSTDGYTWQIRVHNTSVFNTVGANQITYGAGFFWARATDTNALIRLSINSTSQSNDFVSYDSAGGATYVGFPNILYRINLSTPTYTTGGSFSNVSGDITSGSGNVTDITFGQERYLAVKPNNFYISTNGIAFSSVSGGTPVNNGNVWNQASYGNGNFVVVNSNGSQIAYSSNGQTWQTTTGPDQWNGFSKISFAANRFIMTSTNGVFFNYVSTNGVTWSAVYPSFSDAGMSRIVSGMFSNSSVPLSTIISNLDGSTQTLTNKTLNLSSNTLTGTTAQFNTSLSDGDFATLAGTETLTNKTLNNYNVTGQTKEDILTSATGFAGYTYNVMDDGIQFITANSTANGTINFRGNGSTTLNTFMSNNHSVTCVLLVTNGATPFFPNAFQIDGTTVTVRWQGGTAPTSGNANSIDAYTFTIIKTASATYTVLASQTRFA